MTHQHSFSALLLCLLIVVCAVPATDAGATLDIRPSICPNLINRDARALVRVALVGDVDFPVWRVNVRSLELSRADGVGGSVAPRAGRRGRIVRRVDLAAPAASESCSTFGVDGIRDLGMRFGQQAIVHRLELDTLAANATIELCLSGQTRDGSPFLACDQVTVSALSGLTPPRLDDLGSYPLRSR